MEISRMIQAGETVLGIEFGSTNIKAVLVGNGAQILASGSHRWESHVQDGYYTYAQSEIMTGLQDAYRNLKQEVQQRYGITLRKTGCIGISGMMHGYLAFDGSGVLLVPFRTWQNTNTTQAVEELSEAFAVHIPERWSIAHLYQAILDREPHVPQIAKLTTLAGYVHGLLTGCHVLGIGDASGMFPIDSSAKTYHSEMLEIFRRKALEHGFAKPLETLLPQILTAGEAAGVLTAQGALLLDPDGDLEEGICFCPPEGDAGTGMTATNSVRVCTGNVSAGTSVFAMIVLEKPLREFYREIDFVATPAGDPALMVHCNNCTGDLNAWAGLLQAFVSACTGGAENPGKIYETIYRLAEKGEPDCAGTVVCNYIAGEPVTGVSHGGPLVSRDPAQPFRPENLCRAFLYSAVVSLKIGMEVLQKEHIPVNRLVGHGGLFKNGMTAAGFLASALRTPVSIMENAEVGGPYGMALLAMYCIGRGEGETLEQFLENRIFRDVKMQTARPVEQDAAGIDRYSGQFRKLLERTLQ